MFLIILIARFNIPGVILQGNIKQVGRKITHLLRLLFQRYPSHVLPLQEVTVAVEAVSCEAEKSGRLEIYWVGAARKLSQRSRFLNVTGNVLGHRYVSLLKERSSSMIEVRPKKIPQGRLVREFKLKLRASRFWRPSNKLRQSPSVQSIFKELP